MISLMKSKNIIPRCSYLIRCASNMLQESDDIIFTGSYTDEEQAKVLKILNESTADQLTRFKVTQGRIKSLQSWKHKKGPFKNLSQILEVDGLATDILDKLCYSILNDDKETTPPVQDNKYINKIKRQLVSPVLSTAQLNNINTVIGIHLDLSGISWTKMIKGTNKITDWNYYSFSEFPKKHLPIDTFNLAIDILKVLPGGDVYIFETNKSNKGGQVAKATYSEASELSSMLLALINTSIKYNSDIEIDKNIYVNKVYYLKSNAPARIFGTLIGNERVSSKEIVQNLLENNTNSPGSGVVFDDELIKQYQRFSKSYKDLLEKSLLLTLTFMNLVVYKNPNSFKMILSNQNESK